MCVNREYVQNSLCGDNSLSGCYGVKFLSHCKTSSTKPQTIGFITLNIINQISKKKKNLKQIYFLAKNVFGFFYWTHSMLD